MKRRAVAAIIAAAVIALGALVYSLVWRGEGDTVEAKVVYVVDGDTIIVDTEKRREVTVRLIGPDTPETKKKGAPIEPYGPEASAYTTSRLDGREVTLEYDAERFDRYGRDLCYVWLDGELFNETLLKEGYATIMIIPPNEKYVSRFKAAQKTAKRNRLGLWGLD